jgi:hypothetical protein
MSVAARHLSPLPPVERVRPGIWSVPVPIPSSSLRYVFVYAFETDAGPFIVDAGWNTDDAFAALSDGLAEAGTAIADVQGVLVTHIHPDHYGLAGRVREASGAWVALHPADAGLIPDRYEDPTGLLERMSAHLRRMGAPDDEVDTLTNASMPVRPSHRAVDAGPLSRPPLLLGGRQPADAVGRPRAAPHHAQHSLPPPGGRGPPRRLHPVARPCGQL